MSSETNRSKTKTGKEIMKANLDFLKVQRCLSHRVGAKTASNVCGSAEIKTENSQLIWSAKRESAVLKPNNKANIINVH